MEKPLGDNAKKFLFDTNDFGEEALRKKVEAAKKPIFSQSDMEASRQTGFEEGKIIGINETLASQEAHIRDLLQQIVIAASRLEEDEAKRNAHFIDQATLLATQALTRTIPTLLDYLALEQISRFIKNVLSENTTTQNIAIFVNAQNKEHIEKRLQNSLDAMPRKISCTIQTDANLNHMQCRFEWLGGGAQWSPDKTAHGLLGTIISHLPAHLQNEVNTVNPTETLDEPAITTHTSTINQESAP
jgi:flagellar biosynthesis/type III secretory pathway protein FliH